MVKIRQFINNPSRKILLAFTLTVIMYIAISGIFSVPINPTTINFSIKAGGLSFYLVGVLFLLTVLKATFLEFVDNSSLRSSVLKVFRFLHKFLGWIIFILALYHSLFFICYYIWPVDEVSVFLVISGLSSMISLVFVMMLSKNAQFKDFDFESAYFRHIFTTIILILLTIIHLNFL